MVEEALALVQEGAIIPCVIQLSHPVLRLIYTSALNLRRDAQACAVTYAVPDVHLSKNLTLYQFYADRKRCDWSARTPLSVSTWVVCVFMCTLIYFNVTSSHLK